jgi:hypothetical protein
MMVNGFAVRCAEGLRPSDLSILSWGYAPDDWGEAPTSGQLTTVRRSLTAHRAAKPRAFSLLTFYF